MSPKTRELLWSLGSLVVVVAGFAIFASLFWALQRHVPFLLAYGLAVVPLAAPLVVIAAYAYVRHRRWKKKLLEQEFRD